MVIIMNEIALKIDFEDNRFLMFEIDQIANEYESKKREMIRMTLGKSELPLHPDITRAMQNALEDFKKSSSVYPAGLPELKAELAEYYTSKYAVNVSPSNIIISVGTSSIFRNIFQLMLNKDDEVLLPLPYYSLYRFSALLVGAKIRYYKIDTDTLELDRQSFIDNMSDRTKLVVLNSPGNPLGNILTTDDMHFIDRAVGGRAYIISDEIYANMNFDASPLSCVQLRDTVSTFILTNAFSKGYRMYSRRVGYCIVPDELVVPLTVMQHHTLLTADPVAQFGALEALKHEDEVEKLHALYKGRRDYAIEILGNVDHIRVIPAKGSFYITVDCADFMRLHNIWNTRELAEDIAHTQFVATVPGSDFSLDTMLRLSYSTSRFVEGIDKLATYFHGDI